MNRSKRFWTHIVKYRMHSLFVKNFIISIVLIIIPLIIILSLAIGSNERIFAEEMEKLVSSNLTHSARMLDTLFKDINYVAGSLSLNDEVREFIFPHSTHETYWEIQAKSIIPSLRSLTARIKPISSIYIYGEEQNRIITNDTLVNNANFDDINWMERYEESKNGQPDLFTRNIFSYSNNTFDDTPNGITLMKALFRLSKEKPFGAVIINMSHGALTEYLRVDEIDGHLFILKENYEILYSRNRSHLQKKMEEITPIPSFPEIRNPGTIYVDHSENSFMALTDSEETNLVYLLQIPLTHFGEQQLRLRELSIKLIMIALATALLASFFLSLNSYKPIRRLLNVLENPHDSDKGGVTSNEMKYIVQNIMITLNANKDLKAELTEQLSLLDHTRTAALQAQINPHFLYNTLETIRWSAIELTGGDNRASQMISDLAKLLRLSLETVGNTTSLETEVTHACMFIRLLKARYPDKLTVNWDIDENLNDLPILKLCLQPLIENAYYHGIKPTRRRGFINIQGRKAKEYLTITIEDNGKGIDDHTLMNLQKKLKEKISLQEEHIGILNVHQRMQLVFGDDFGIQLESEQNRGTLVTLRFPSHDKDNP